MKIEKTKYTSPETSVIDMAMYREVLQGGDMVVISKGNVGDFQNGNDIGTGDYDDIIP